MSRSNFPSVASQVILQNRSLTVAAQYDAGEVKGRYRAATVRERCVKFYAGHCRKSVVLLLLAASLHAQSYDIRPEKGAHWTLEVFKTGLMSGKKHVFFFERYDGKLNFDATNLAHSTVDLTLEAASITNNDDWISAKDRKKVLEYALVDMLDAAHYPGVRFTSSAVSKLANGKFEVTGMLTIRGQARPVTVQVSMSPASEGRLSFAGNAVVNLKDYGTKPRASNFLVGVVIGTKSEMKVEFELIAVPAG